MGFKSSKNFKKLGEGVCADVNKIHTVFPLNGSFPVSGTTRKLAYETAIERQIGRAVLQTMKTPFRKKQNNKPNKTKTTSCYESGKQH